MPWALAISAAVVHAVREQDHDLRLGVALAQAVDGRGQTVADGRAVLDQTAADAGQQGLEGALVRGQGALREGLAGEGDQADPVAVAVGDERAGDLLGRRDAVGLEVAGEHRPRDVDGQHDVDTLGVRPGILFDALRAGQRHDGQGQRCEPQHERQVAQPVAERLRGAGESVDARQADRGAALHRPPDVVDGQRHEQRQQPKAVWGCEVHCFLVIKNYRLYISFVVAVGSLRRFARTKRAGLRCPEAAARTAPRAVNDILVTFHRPVTSFSSRAPRRPASP